MLVMAESTFVVIPKKGRKPKRLSHIKIKINIMTYFIRRINADFKDYADDK
jgi:hypothetical protein